MNGFPFSKTAEMRVGIAIDIGSKSVGGAIFVKTPAGKPKLIYVTREKIAFQKILIGKNLSATMLKTLDLVLFHLEKYGIKHLQQSKTKYRVDDINVVISSLWHTSETKTVKLSFNCQSAVIKTAVDELLMAEEKSFEQKTANGSSEGSSLERLEQKIIEIRLNGYPTAKPYGKLATELEIRMFESLVSSEIINAVKKLIDKRFPESHSQFHTFSIAAFVAIRDTFPEVDSFLIVQIGGEMTDVTIVKNNIILETNSFPFGHNSLLRGLAKICHNHPDCTFESLLKLHQESKIHGEDWNNVEAAIVKTKGLWLKHFNSAISNFSAETFIPKNVFLFEEDPNTSLFETFLKDAEASQFTVTAEPFIVTSVNQAMATSFAEFDNSQLIDEMLAMEVSFTQHLKRPVVKVLG